MTTTEQILLSALKLIAKRTNGGDTREAMVVRKIAREAIAQCGEAKTKRGFYGMENTL